MKRKKKYPNLPNGFGSIRKLSGNRRNPYAVHPPVVEYAEDGKPVTPKALCYVSDWYIGFAVLTAYKAGTYVPGMEKTLELLRPLDSSNINLFTQRILSDYTIATRSSSSEKSMSFEELYERFYSWKYEGKKKYSDQSKNSTRAAFNNCEAVHDKDISRITYEDLQRIVDNCPLKHSSLELIVSLCKQMYRYAVAQGLVEKNPTDLLRINIPDDDDPGVPFSTKDLERIWSRESDDTAQLLLIMCYSGFRIGELEGVSVDLKKRSFFGGLKTDAGRNRTVPIHSCIFGIVKKRMKLYGRIMPDTYQAFRNNLAEFLPAAGIGEHTAHDCRHTFSMLCERYGVSDNDRKRMLGHKIKDVTNGVYGHRSLDDLRKEIEKIPCLKRVENGSEKSS